MNDFETWYETYERDGGELMIYNTIDLEMAYGAGQKAGFREASDKAATLPQRAMFDAGYERGRRAGLEEIEQADHCRAKANEAFTDGYTKGRKAGLEEAAEIADYKAQVVADYTNEDTAYVALVRVAAAIRERMNKQTI